jgi:hypothetical protein
MAVPELKERTLDELSRIKVRFFLGPATSQPHLLLLVIRYEGTYGHGSAGNEDAQFMYAMARAGVDAFEPWGVIHDLSALAYEWGDLLERVFTVGPRDEGAELLGAIFGTSTPSPAGQPAVVVGPRCEEAIRTLLLGENCTEPVEKFGYVFRSLQAAWEFVDSQIV